MAYDLGFKALRRLCEEQKPMTWHRAKLSEDLFRGPEKAVYNWVSQHVKSYHTLPQVVTLEQAFPVLAAVQAPEPSSYYLDKVQSAYFYSVINQANIDSQAALKANQDDYATAREILRAADRKITQQMHRTKIMDLGLEAPKAVLTEYHGINKSDNYCEFGWPHMDDQGSIVPGDVISFVGRPAQGKSWMMLYIALHNWRYLKKNVLFVSMEMNPLSIAQRVTAMYAHVPYGQLKKSGFSSSTYKKFESSMLEFKAEEAKFYCVDGNLAVSVEEIYALADLLECDLVDIDGAYLCRHPNARLDRFTRVAENVRIMKQATGDRCTLASWQFARSAVKGKTKDSKGQTSEKAGMEDIGMSDEIPQVSSIVMAMDQEDSVETLIQRRIRLLKGRSGEIGGFNINWGFDTMDFTQVVETDEPKKMVAV